MKVDFFFIPRGGSQDSAYGGSVFTHIVLSIPLGMRRAFGVLACFVVWTSFSLRQTSRHDYQHNYSKVDGCVVDMWWMIMEVMADLVEAMTTFLFLSYIRFCATLNILIDSDA